MITLLSNKIEVSFSPKGACLTGVGWWGESNSSNTTWLNRQLNLDNVSDELTKQNSVIIKSAVTDPRRTADGAITH